MSNYEDSRHMKRGVVRRPENNLEPKDRDFIISPEYRNHTKSIDDRSLIIDHRPSHLSCNIPYIPHTIIPTMDEPNKKTEGSTANAKKTEEEEKVGRRTSMEAAQAIEDEYEKIMNGS
jgi:hypothetical protein